jgi:hypothetical protein
MVLDGDDRPFASCLWPGNTADVTRLMPVVQRLRERFGIAQVCIVADRGMISAATLAALEKAGLEYILGVRERSTKEVRNEVIEDDGVAVPLVIPRQKGETQLAIKETTLKGRRYVLCRNEEEVSGGSDCLNSFSAWISETFAGLGCRAERQRVEVGLVGCRFQRDWRDRHRLAAPGIGRDVRQLEQLPAAMGPTQGRGDRPRCARRVVQLVVAAVGVRLQDASEAVKMPCGILAPAIA